MSVSPTCRAPRTPGPTAERWRAVYQAAAFGLEPMLVQADYTIDAGCAAADEALRRGPTALIAANDLCAIGALARLADKGVRCRRTCR